MLKIITAFMLTILVIGSFPAAIPALELVSEKSQGKTGTKWEKLGIGDCSAHDVGASEGATPVDVMAMESHVAICWDGATYQNGNAPGKAWCTYKSLTPRQCVGGSNRGIMYGIIAKEISIKRIGIVNSVEPTSDLIEAEIGQEFRVKVTLNEAPQANNSPISVSLRNLTEGNTINTVADIQTSNPLVFLSQPIRIVSPEGSEERELQ